MARQGRLHVPYATYFVVNRFRPGLDVLVPAAQRTLDPDRVRRIEANRRRFEGFLRHACTRWCARVHAYCWLPDSTQLLIEVSRVPLESVLRSLRGPLARLLRNRAGVSTSLYVGRYTALLIDPRELYLDFVRHIFWSPVNARLVKSPLAYEFSSARVCLGERPPGFLYAAGVSEALAASGYASRAAFERFLTSRPKPTFAGLLAHGSPLDSRIAGGPTFVREIQRASRAPSRAPPLDAVLSWASARLDLPIELITRRSRHHVAVQARALVAWLATCTGSASLADIAVRFSCGPSSLHRAIRHYTRLQPRLFNYMTLREFERAATTEEFRPQAADRDSVIDDFSTPREPSDSD